MVLYSCKRCGFNTHIRTHYQNHIFKKFICNPKLSNVDRSIVQDEFIKMVKSKVIQKGSLYPNNLKKLHKLHKLHEKEYIEESSIGESMGDSMGYHMGENTMEPMGDSMSEDSGDSTEESMSVGDSMGDFGRESVLKESLVGDSTDASMGICETMNEEYIEMEYTEENIREEGEVTDSDTTTTNDLQKILNSKTDDNSDNRHACKYCRKAFSNNSHLHRHMRESCKSNRQLITQLSQLTQLSQIKELEIENEHLRKTNDTLLKINKQMNKTTISNNTNNNITNNITLNVYGNEDFRYIANDLLTSFHLNPYESIPRLVGLIHFNPKHPENHNIRWTNINKNRIQRFEKKGWTNRDKKDVIRDLNDQAYLAVDIEYDPKTTKLNENQKRHYEKFRSDYDNDVETTKKRLEKRTEYIILDKRRKYKM